MSFNPTSRLPNNPYYFLAQNQGSQNFSSENTTSEYDTHIQRGWNDDQSPDPTEAPFVQSSNSDSSNLASFSLLPSDEQFMPPLHSNVPTNSSIEPLPAIPQLAPFLTGLEPPDALSAYNFLPPLYPTNPSIGLLSFWENPQAFTISPRQPALLPLKRIRKPPTQKKKQTLPQNLINLIPPSGWTSWDVLNQNHTLEKNKQHHYETCRYFDELTLKDPGATCPLRGNACNFNATKSKGEIRDHILTRHIPYYPLKCTIDGCDKVFATEKTLDRHLKACNLKKLTLLDTGQFLNLGFSNYEHAFS